MSNKPYAKDKKGAQAKLSGLDVTPLYPGRRFEWFFYFIKFLATSTPQPKPEYLEWI